MKIICIISNSPGHTFHRLTSGNLHFYLTLVPGWCPGPTSHARRMLTMVFGARGIRNVSLTDGDIRNDQAVVDTFPDVSNCPPGLQHHDTGLVRSDFKTYLMLWFSSNIWNMKGINDLTKDKGQCTQEVMMLLGRPCMFYWVTETNL